MSEPTSILKFSDLLTKIAREAGLAYYGSTGNEKAMPPIDVHDLEMCEEIVNGGIRMFIADAPITGWRWSHRIMSLTFDTAGTGASNIDSDAARYMLSEGFGGEIDGPVHYAKNTNHGTRINWCSEAEIRAMRAQTVQTGYPNLAAILPYQPVSSSLSSTRKWELIVNPQPTAADTIEFPYTLAFNKLDLESGCGDSGSDTTLVDAERTEGDDYFNDWKIEILSGTGKGSYATVTDYTGTSGTFTVADWLKSDGTAGGTNPDENSIYIVEPATNLHPAGAKFDEVILAACLFKAEMSLDDVSAGYVEKYIKKDLPKAYQTDARSAPRKLGNMGIQTVRGRTWTDVTYN